MGKSGRASIRRKVALLALPLALIVSACIPGDPIPPVYAQQTEDGLYVVLHPCLEVHIRSIEITQYGQIADSPTVWRASRVDGSVLIERVKIFGDELPGFDVVSTSNPEIGSFYNIDVNSDNPNVATGLAIQYGQLEVGQVQYPGSGTPITIQEYHKILPTEFGCL